MRYGFGVSFEAWEDELFDQYCEALFGDDDDPADDAAEADEE